MEAPKVMSIMLNTDLLHFYRLLGHFTLNFLCLLTSKILKINLNSNNIDNKCHFQNTRLHLLRQCKSCNAAVVFVTEIYETSSH